MFDSAIDGIVIEKFAYLMASILFILGLKKMTHPRTSVRGNLFGALGMLLAIIVIMLNLQGYTLVAIGLAIGAVIGAVLALRIQMTAMPQLVALFNGFGGLASILVAGGALLISNEPNADELLATGLSGLIGAVTFAGSLIAFGKLQELQIFRQAIKIPGQQVINALLAVCCLLMIWLLLSQYYWIYIPLVLFSLGLGVLLVISIGGADMPVWRQRPPDL